MTTANELRWRATLSACWIFVLVNMLLRDIHQLFSPGVIEAMMAGIMNGTRVTEALLLAAGIVLEVPIAMVVLCWVLPAGVSRWANLAATLLTVALVVAGAPADLDDRFFALMQLGALAGVAGTAWRGAALTADP